MRGKKEKNRKNNFRSFKIIRTIVIWSCGNISTGPIVVRTSNLSQSSWIGCQPGPIGALVSPMTELNGLPQKKHHMGTNTIFIVDKLLLTSTNYEKQMYFFTLLLNMHNF